MEHSFWVGERVVMHLSRCSSPGEGRVDAGEGSMPGCSPCVCPGILASAVLRTRAMHPAFLVDGGGEEPTADKVTCVRVALAVTEGRRLAFCSGGARKKRT